MHSRRSFARTLVVAVAVTAIPAKSFAALRPFRRMSHIAEVTLARIEPWVNSRFQVLGDGISISLDLIEAEALPRHVPELGEKFSLILRGSAAGAVPQRTYRFTHPRAGEFDLFIVPIASDEPGTSYYQAIINREATASGPQAFPAPASSPNSNQPHPQLPNAYGSVHR